MKPNYFKLIVLASLVFVVAYLFQFDLVDLPVLHSKVCLAISLLLLLIGFLFQAINWQVILRKELPISFADAFVSVGLSVFTKYIPGKVMVILGKAEYVQRKYGYGRKELITRSFESQILTLWIGLLIGSASLFYVHLPRIWYLYFGLGFLLFSLFLFTPFFHSVIGRTSRVVIKKDFNIPRVSLNTLIGISPYYIFYWLLFAAGFYFLVQAFTYENFSPSLGLVFPLAAVMGILAIIAPGGLGVREGFIVAGLVLFGMDEKLAVGISLAARLWFLFGEFMIFFSAFYLRSKQLKNRR